MANAKSSRIGLYFHCKECVGIEFHGGKKLPVDKGEHLAVGWTKEGFQVVCENCGKNVIDVDFCGQQVGFYKKGRDYMKDPTFLKNLETVAKEGKRIEDED